MQDNHREPIRQNGVDVDADGAQRAVDVGALGVRVPIAEERELLRINGAIAEADQTAFERDALFADFVIGLEPCEAAIAEARYLQANAMLGQELEILAQLKAVRANRRKLNGAPNVAVLEQSLPRLYGGLSAAAHVSQHHIVQTATS